VQQIQATASYLHVDVAHRIVTDRGFARQVLSIRTR
jgi:hypothetical protein